VIFNLLAPLADEFILFNLFRYLTFRAGAACMTALFLSLLIGPSLIRWLRANQNGGQPIREDGPESHLLTKKGTPTMGGLLILIALVVSTMMWADLRNQYVWAVLLVTLGFGALGFADDWLKVTKRNTKGVSGRQKLVVQWSFGLAAAIWMMLLLPSQLSTTVALPIFKEVLVPLGFAFPLFAAFVMVGASNAVNLTDGLDGLAIVPVMIASFAMMVLTWIASSERASTFLMVPHGAGSGELMVVSGAMAGACLGFLWFNVAPAQIFMGDTGSLAMGGLLATVAVCIRQEVLLVVIGGVFYLEALSVILQVGWFKWTKRRFGEGRRILLCAPAHHHFQHAGWKETQVVGRFYLVAITLAILALVSLKLR